MINRFRGGSKAVGFISLFVAIIVIVIWLVAPAVRVSGGGGVVGEEQNWFEQW